MEEAKEVLRASLSLSILKHTKHHVSRNIAHAQSKAVAASGSCAPTHEPGDSNPPFVQLVNALTDSIGKCFGPFTKMITNSDVGGKESRLLLPKECVDEFIRPLLEKDEDPWKGVPVLTFNTAAKAYPMKFKYRRSGKASGMKSVLMGSWHKFVAEKSIEVLGCPQDLGVSLCSNQENCAS